MLSPIPLLGVSRDCLPHPGEFQVRCLGGGWDPGKWCLGIPPSGRPSGISPNHLHWDHLQTGCERHSSHHILLYHSRIIPSAWQPDSLAQTIPFLGAGLGRFWCRSLSTVKCCYWHSKRTNVNTVITQRYTSQ